MPPAYSHDIFVSHNYRDKPWVRQFVKLLREEGLKVFFDEDDIDYGADIVASIDNALEQSKHVILVISPRSLSSRWIALESSMSIYSDPDARNKKLIPLLLELVPRESIQLSIRRLNTVDLTT
jgi:hypothetical protein